MASPEVPPPPDEPPAGVQTAEPRRVVLTAAVAALLILSGLLTFWVVTGSGPFASIVPSRWALDMTQVSDLHARGLSGEGVTVCIVDTGIDLTHPELRGVNLVRWRDFVNFRSAPYDDEGHGTAMAAIIAAQGVLPGVSPRASLIVAKAVASSGSGTDFNIATAIRFCVDPDLNGRTDDGADVISLSLGGRTLPFVGTSTEREVNAAMDRGVYVVAAAGNDGGPGDNGNVESPASVDRVIAVGAVNSQGVIAPWSSMGRDAGYTDPNEKPEVVAPGVSIATALPDGRYAYVSGTSPAAALVAGIVALLLQDHAPFRHDGTRLLAFKTALMYGACGCSASPPHDPHYGYGVVKARATDAALPP